jgi:betaine/carnitine transporter, BCCT family
MNKKEEVESRKRLIDYKIFIPCTLIIATVSILFSTYESESLHLLNRIFGYIVKTFSWGYIWYAVIVFIAALFFSFSKYGNIVLGDPTEKPNFTMFEYASILIATGLGSTIMRTGLIQWTDVALDPPFGVEPQSVEALLWGSSYSMFIWSPLIFAIFVVSAPAIAYVLHVRNKPSLRISEACRSVLGDKITDGIGGIIIDVIFLISILSGAAVTLGFSAPIITYNVAELFKIEVTFGLSLFVTIVWVLLFTISAYLGIEKGIKKLSTFNMYLAGAFAIFILIAGPGIFIINYFTESVGFVFKHYIDMSFYTNSLNLEETSFMERNTVFWIAYNATWGMLGSVFVAKISRGRTIKEMILTYLLAPTLISWITTGVLGGLSVHRYLTGDVPVLDIVQEDPILAIPEILSSLPLATIAIIAFIFVATIFLTTTLDSTTYTIAAYTSMKNMSKEEPSKILRIIAAAFLAIVAIVLMRIGGLAPLEVLSGIMGIPIIFVQFLTVYAAKKMMDEDKAWKYNVRYDQQAAMHKEEKNKIKVSS